MQFRPTPVRLITLIVVATGIPAAAAGAQTDLRVAKPAAKRAAMLLNGSFDQSSAGWSTWNASLSLVTPGANGAGALKVAVTKRAGSYAVSTSPAAVLSTEAQRMYVAGGLVRSDRAKRDVCLRLREYADGSSIGSAQACALTATTWKPLPSVAYTAKGAGNQIVLDVFARNAGSGDSFVLDSMSLDDGAATSAGSAPAPAPTGPVCDRYASTSGSDGAAGTAAAPLRTVQALVDQLTAGQTGCLQPGAYVENVKVSRGGSPGSPVTLTSAVDAERATVQGRFWIADSADDVRVANLRLNGRNANNLPSPTVNGDRVTFVDNDVTNDHTTICFVLGSTSGYGTAVDAVIERNRVHDCGRLPATNKDHGIYLESTRNARIVANTIYDNADRGIQLYPDAQGSLIAKNVIDGNGSGIIFSGADGFASSGNVVTDNVISNATLRYNVESWWPSGNPVGTGNRVEGNCIWNGAQGNVDEQVGFTVTGSIVSDPLFVDRAAKNFALRAGSPCAGKTP